MDNKMNSYKEELKKTKLQNAPEITDEDNFVRNQNKLKKGGNKKPWFVIKHYENNAIDSKFFEVPNQTVWGRYETEKQANTAKQTFEKNTISAPLMPYNLKYKYEVIEKGEWEKRKKSLTP